MKKDLLFNLQLFADETADTETDTDTENPTEDNEQSTGSEGGERKYTDEDVNRFLKKEKVKWQKQQQRQQQQTTEAERLSRMTTDEQNAERIRQLEERLAEADRRDARAAMTKEARTILHTANINVSDELLANLIADDAESTQASVKSFISLFKAEVEKGIKEAYKGETPKKGGAPSLTAEQIMKIENPRERQRLIRENLHLFQQG